jgi:tRNA uridine 5-carboxymethylaminomethyl modification enzyme
MFTSRAEYRLTLRADNADQRLTEKGVQRGCVGSERQQRFEAKAAALADAQALLRGHSLSPNEAARFGLRLNHDGVRRTGFDLLGFPDIDFAALQKIWPDLGRVGAAIAGQVEVDAKYAVYLDRQAADIRAFRRDEALAIPDDLDYAQLPGLSREISTRLSAVRPQTIGQASRIEGMTPTALTLLASQIRRAGARR